MKVNPNEPTSKQTVPLLKMPLGMKKISLNKEKRGALLSPRIKYLTSPDERNSAQFEEAQSSRERELAQR